MNYNLFVHEKVSEYERRERLQEAETQRAARDFLAWLRGQREQAEPSWTHMRKPETFIAQN
jgi:hypothetical protein